MIEFPLYVKSKAHYSMGECDIVYHVYDNNGLHICEADNEEIIKEFIKEINYKEEKKPCMCFYPCNTVNCPKKENEMCHVNYCKALKEYLELTYDTNYCSECGRKLK